LSITKLFLEEVAILALTSKDGLTLMTCCVFFWIDPLCGSSSKTRLLCSKYYTTLFILGFISLFEGCINYFDVTWSSTIQRFAQHHNNLSQKIGGCGCLINIHSYNSQSMTTLKAREFWKQLVTVATSVVRSLFT